MVTLIFYVLSYFHVLSFTWWVPFIESIVLALIAGSVFSPETQTSHASDLIVSGLVGVAVFSFSKLFLQLSIHAWAVFLSPVWFLIATFCPGGFTITDYILKKNQLMNVPTWVWIVSILFDLLTIVVLVYGKFASKKK